MRVAAYQAPLEATASMEIIGLIGERVAWCEAAGVEFLCCPEAVLGGLADYASRPDEAAIDVENGGLEPVLARLGSDTVTTIVGFTEIDRHGRLFNAAAVFHQRTVVGIYRKRHPAINRSVYEAGDKTPVFTVGGLTFGIIICRDSSFRDPAAAMAGQGASVLFVPSNTGLPPAKGGLELIAETRAADTARAVENRVWVIRADVAGRQPPLVAYGSSAIVDPDGAALATGRLLTADLIVADIDIARSRRGTAAFIV